MQLIERGFVTGSLHAGDRSSARAGHVAAIVNWLGQGM
jgi:hypothetical protein